LHYPGTSTYIIDGNNAGVYAHLRQLFLSQSIMPMKNHKSQHTTPKHGKKASLKKLSSYIDEEVTLIHENLEDLKAFLAEHSAMQQENELHADLRDVDDYYDSANDLFKQIALEDVKDTPLEAKFYETLILRKKKKS
jgi:hypothetical protein